MEHLWKEGLNNQLMTECGNDTPREGEGICPTCIERKQERRAHRAAMAKKLMESKSQKLKGMEDTKIYD